MAQKNATPSKEQQEIMKRSDLQPMCWTVLQDLNHTMIVRHRITGEVKVIIWHRITGEVKVIDK